MSVISQYSRRWLSILCVALLLGSSLLQGVAVQAAPNIIYHVKEGGDDNKDGAGWANAFANLQTALDVAIPGDEIRIAAGTYYPTKESTPGDKRTATFQMINGVVIYGGFVGNDDNEAVESRDWKTNKAILSGDLGKNDNPNDVSVNVRENAYHVFYHPAVINLNNTAVLDGVTIVGGNANGSGDHSKGGGIFNESSNPKLTNVTLSGNTTITTIITSGLGGGMYNLHSNPVLTNVTLSGNTAVNGGGMFNEGSNPVLKNVTLKGNTASYWGGGMYNEKNSNPVLTDVTLSGNKASNSGGGMVNLSSHPKLTNVTLSGNTAKDGGGMANQASNPVLTDVNLSGNTASNSGGGMRNHDSNPVLTHVTLSGNTASNGGAMYNNSSSKPEFTNVTISGNTASALGGGMYNSQNSSPIVNKSIIWGNSDSIYNDRSTSTFTNSIIEGSGGSTGWIASFGENNGGNIDEDPLFVDPRDTTNAPTVGGDYRLRPGSPAIVGNIIMGALGIYELPITNVVNPRDIPVSFGAKLSAINFPSNVDVTLSDNTTQSIPVTWDSGNPVFDGNTPGNYEFTGDLTLPTGVTNPDNLQATVKVIVEPPVATTTIDSIETISDLLLPVGTDSTNINLPANVVGTLSDMSTPSIPVKWDDGTPVFDGNTPGDYVFTGTLTLPTGVTNPNNLQANVKVIVGSTAATTIDHVNALTDIHVPVSADTASVNLPANVIVTLSDTTTSSIPVTSWDAGTPVFDGNTPGNYLFTGTLAPPTGVTNPKSLLANVNVIVQPAITDAETPKWPVGSNLSLTDITTTSVRLAWPTAIDNIAVTSYHIYVNGVEKTIAGNHELSYVMTGLSAQTTYNFSVQAYDAAGNRSFDLNGLATTLSPPVYPDYPDSGSGNSGSEPSYVPSNNNNIQELIVYLNGLALPLTSEGSSFTTETEAAEVELFLKIEHSAAKATLNGHPFVERQKTPLEEGTNVFEFVIEAENGTKKTYKLTIHRLAIEPEIPVEPVVPKKPKTVVPLEQMEFTDVPGHWAEEYIQQATTLGILKGYPDGTFKPNDPLTRAQAASIIVRALNLQSDEAAPFKDIGNYADETQAEIAAAYQFGIIKGSNGDFKPSDKITRAQIALMIQRVYEYKTGTKYESAKAPYSDFGNYDAETTNAISMLHELGIATGSEGKFNPGNQTTRAQAAKMFVNLLASLK